MSLNDFYRDHDVNKAEFVRAKYSSEMRVYAHSPLRPYDAEQPQPIDQMNEPDDGLLDLSAYVIQPPDVNLDFDYRDADVPDVAENYNEPGVPIAVSLASVDVNIPAASNTVYATPAIRCAVQIKAHDGVASNVTIADLYERLFTYLAQPGMMTDNEFEMFSRRRSKFLGLFSVAENGQRHMNLTLFEKIPKNSARIRLALSEYYFNILDFGLTNSNTLVRRAVIPINARPRGKLEEPVAKKSRTMMVGTKEMFNIIYSRFYTSFTRIFRNVYDVGIGEKTTNPDRSSNERIKVVKEWWRPEFDLKNFFKPEGLVKAWIPISYDHRPSKPTRQEQIDQNAPPSKPIIRNTIGRSLRCSDGRYVSLHYVMNTVNDENGVRAFETRSNIAMFMRDVIVRRARQINHDYIQFVNVPTEMNDWLISKDENTGFFKNISVVEIPVVNAHNFFGWKETFSAVKGKTVRNDDGTTTKTTSEFDPAKRQIVASMIIDILLAALAVLELGYVIQEPTIRLSEKRDNSAMPTIVSSIDPILGNNDILESIQIECTDEKKKTLPKPKVLRMIKRNLSAMPYRCILNNCLYVIPFRRLDNVVLSAKNMIENLIEPLRNETAGLSEAIRKKYTVRFKAVDHVDNRNDITPLLEQVRNLIWSIYETELKGAFVNPELIEGRSDIRQSNISPLPQLDNLFVLPFFVKANDQAYAIQRIQPENAIGTERTLEPIRFRDYKLYLVNANEFRGSTDDDGGNDEERGNNKTLSPYKKLEEMDMDRRLFKSDEKYRRKPRGFRKAVDGYMFFRLCDSHFAGYFEGLARLHEAGYSGFRFVGNRSCLLLDITTGTTTLNVTQAMFVPGQYILENFDIYGFYGRHTPIDLPEDRSEAIRQCDVYNLMCEILLSLDEIHEFERPVLDVDISDNDARREPTTYYKAVFERVYRRYHQVQATGINEKKSLSKKHTHLVAAASRVFQTDTQNNEYSKRFTARELARTLYRPDMIKHSSE